MALISARDVLRLLLVPPPTSSPPNEASQEPRRAFDYFHQKEIYPGLLNFVKLSFKL